MQNNIFLLDIVNKYSNSKYMTPLCKIINKSDDLQEQLIKYTEHLNVLNPTINQRIYHLKYNIGILLCQCNKYLKWTDNQHYNNTCGDNICITINRKKTLLLKYGEDSYAKTKEFKNNMIEKYGYISAFEKKETHEKSKNTLLNKYGVDHNSKLEDVKISKIKNSLSKWGTNTPSENLEIKEKIKHTNIIKYGGVSPMCNDTIKEKAKTTYLKNDIKNIIEKRENTCLNKYGVSHHMQVDYIFEKVNSYKRKDYIINNKIIKFQGYEDYAYFNLLNTYEESDIIYGKDIKNYVKIWYCINDKKRRYYPDFYIKSENKIIEVKSNYTYKNRLNINLEKQTSCINAGINFIFMIIDKKEYNIWKSKNNKNEKN